MKKVTVVEDMLVRTSIYVPAFINAGIIVHQVLIYFRNASMAVEERQQRLDDLKTQIDYPSEVKVNAIGPDNFIDIFERDIQDDNIVFVLDDRLNIGETTLGSVSTWIKEECISRRHISVDKFFFYTTHPESREILERNFPDHVLPCLVSTHDRSGLMVVDLDFAMCGSFMRAIESN